MGERPFSSLRIPGRLSVGRSHFTGPTLRAPDAVADGAQRGAGARDDGGAEARHDLHDARTLDNGRDMVDERAAVEVAERTASRPVDGKAIAAATLAVFALAAAQWWIIGTVAALAAIAFALASRRAVRADPNLRGATLGVLGFIVAVGVLVFATVGPSLVALLLVTLAPPG